MFDFRSPVTVRYFRYPNGESPFLGWLHSLKDSIGRSRLMVRIDRLGRGNLGDFRTVGHGVFELRDHYGPGYRIYLGLIGSQEVVILCAGDKSTQSQDIERARRYFALVRGQT